MASFPNRCQYIKVDGTQCGSPALRRNRFCFFHKRHQEERISLSQDLARRRAPSFDLPPLEDANSVQVALMQVTRLLLTRQIDTKTGALVLYALQTASSNLRRTDFSPLTNDVVLDPRSVADTLLDQHVWEDEDFEEEEEDDEEDIFELTPEEEKAVLAERERRKKAKDDFLKDIKDPGDREFARRKLYDEKPLREADVKAIANRLAEIPGAKQAPAKAPAAAPAKAAVTASGRAVVSPPESREKKSSAPPDPPEKKTSTSPASQPAQKKPSTNTIADEIREKIRNQVLKSSLFSPAG